MKTFLLLASLFIALVVSGCGNSDKEVAQNNIEKKENITVGQKQAWCTKAEMTAQAESANENGLWISSEYYQGINPAPTVRHICRGEQELFYLQMDWGNNVSQYIGNLIAIKGVSKFPFVSVNKDPSIVLVESQSKEFPNQVSVYLDGRIVIYDEISNSFKVEEDQVIEPTDKSEEHVIYNIFNVEKKNQTFYFTVASSQWLVGDKAVEVAIKETGCKAERIRDGACAPSLNNGFYISKKFSPKMTLLLADNAEIFTFKESKLTKISAQTFFNFFTQTDAFVMEGNHIPFLIEIENQKIQRIESQYTP